MRITIQALIDREDGKPPTMVALDVVERKSDCAPSAGLGLFIRETHDLLQQLQSVVLHEQVARFLSWATCCKGCGHEHGTKSTGALVYRTNFGKIALRSPQLYSRCAHCKSSASDNATFDPLALALALPERTHPQWVWLQCRFASVTSYRLARIFLRDAFPGGRALGASAMKATVRTIGERLEQEVQHGIQSTAAAFRGQALPIPAREVSADVALQIDAGCIRSASMSDCTRWFAAVVRRWSRWTRGATWRTLAPSATIRGLACASKHFLEPQALHGSSL